ncbi:Carboxylic ester hydrolase [Mycena kentingensis (nom. inval.)]|nr:Carboxylic ester hydrolase [Mycena kentingensis (nom. inval.)]
MFPLVSLLLISLALSSSTNAASAVDVGYARYQGISDPATNITSFLGIRYAAPPTGTFRWRAPQIPKKIEEVQLADTHGPACFQGGLPTNLVSPFRPRADPEAPSEDCLFLEFAFSINAEALLTSVCSVYTPNMKPKKLLPTLVWIHGGGYIIGSAQDYNGHDLVAAMDGSAVVVIVQYRLGLFGFLAGKQVKNDGALNAGLLDQDFALRWVNKMIGNFGGDASRVTIWGQSAGSSLCFITAIFGSQLLQVLAQSCSTSLQMAARRVLNSFLRPSPALPTVCNSIRTTTGFQRRAIALFARLHLTDLQTIFANVSAQAGCANQRGLGCLRALDASTLSAINLNTMLQGFEGTTTFVPVIDGTFIRQSPTSALLERKTNGDRLLAMANTNEGIIFVNQTVDYNVEDYVLQLFPTLGKEEAVEIAAAYSTLGSPVESATHILGEGRLIELILLGTGNNAKSVAMFICPAFLLADSFRRTSYKGTFAIPPSLHGNDVVYYFRGFTGWPASPIFNNTDFITAFQQGFFSFIVNHDPNRKLRSTVAPTWPLWGKGAKEMVFGSTDAGEPDIRVGAADAGLLERCELWKELREKTFQ